MTRKTRHSFLLAAVLAAALAGCGGSGSPVDTVRTFGDSLADAGTFGYSFTIQGANSQIYPSLVSQSYGLKPACAFFSFTGSTFNSNPNCTNFAVGGGVINGAASGLSASDPRTVSVQLAAAVSVRPFESRDLVLVDGGGNDAAALVGAYLASSSDGGAAYRRVLGTLLSSTDLAAAAAGGAAGLAGAGNTYMTALADNFANTLQTQVLDKGAHHVVVLNMPLITLTPRFQAVLGGVAAAAGGGATGAATATQVANLARSWVDTFNGQLSKRLAGDQRYALLDVNAALAAWTASPGEYGFTNVTQASCPVTGVGSDGLPTYNFPTCTETALAAAPPAGATGGANWYKTWLYSDGFHPTPYAHSLIGDIITRALRARSWI